MRKTLILAALTATAMSTTAQNANVVSAYNYLQDGNYAKAAEYIEPAISNESSMAKEKTWRYRGDIYRMIALGEDAALKQQYPDALDKATTSYMKARELDTKKEWERDNILALGALQVASLNAGNEAFGMKNYDLAVKLYENSQKIAASAGQVDSLACFNKALAYEAKPDPANAIAAYRECLGMGYQKLEIHNSIAQQEMALKNVDGALKALNDGLVAYPGNEMLIQNQLSYLLEAGRENEAEPVLLKALEMKPCDPALNSILATLYEKRANPTEGNPPADAEQWTDKAEASYRKAIECQPDFFDANFNLGVLYNNRAAACYEKANNIKDNAQYNKAKTACDQVYSKALPFFETAHGVKPEDGATLQQLMKIYTTKGDNAKYEEMKAKLAALK